MHETHDHNVTDHEQLSWVVTSGHSHWRMQRACIHGLNINVGEVIPTVIADKPPERRHAQHRSAFEMDDSSRLKGVEVRVVVLWQHELQAVCGII